MNCSKNTYQDLSSIVERFASDQQYWSGQRRTVSDISVFMNIAVKFLEAWDIMATNGYSSLSLCWTRGWLAGFLLLQ